MADQNYKKDLSFFMKIDIQGIFWSQNSNMKIDFLDGRKYFNLAI